MFGEEENDAKSQQEQNQASDFLSAISDLTNFMLKSEQRGMDDVQRRIVSKQLIGEIVDKASKMYAKPEFDIATLHDCLAEAIPMTTSALNTVPMTGPLESVWLQLSILSNIWTARFMMFRGKLGLSRMHASATIIAQILSNVPHIREIPKLPQPTAPNYVERLGDVLQMLKSTARLFHAAVTQMHAIASADYTIWASEAFWHYKLLLELVDSLDFMDEYKQTKETPQDFFSRVTFCTASFTGLVDLAFHIQKTLGDGWHSDIKTQDLIKETSLKGLQELYREEGARNRNTIDQLQEAFKRGVFGFNDDPSNDEGIIHLKTLAENGARYVQSLEALEESLPVRHVRAPRSLSVAVQNNLRLLNFIEAKAGGQKRILMTRFAEEYVFELQMLHALLALKAAWDQSVEEYEQTIGSFETVFETADPLVYPDLFFTRVLARLYAHSHSGKPFSLVQARRDLKEILPALEFKPLEYVAVKVLMAILSFLSGSAVIQELESMLSEARELGLTSTGYDHLLSDFDAYIDSLMTVFEGGKPMYIFTSRQERLIHLDVNSWLVPDFSALMPPECIGPIMYLPFNRWIDKIVPSS